LDLDVCIFSNGYGILARKTGIMKIKINIRVKDGEVERVEERQIEIDPEKKMTRKEPRIWLRKMRSIAEKAKAGNLEAIGDAEDYLNFQDEKAVEFSSLSKEEFDKLHIDESNKILGAIGKKIFPASQGDSLF